MKAEERAAWLAHAKNLNGVDGCCTATLPIVHDETGERQRLTCACAAGHDFKHASDAPAGPGWFAWDGRTVRCGGKLGGWGVDGPAWDADNGRDKPLSGKPWAVIAREGK